MIYDKTNTEILEELNSLVYGHMEAKKVLISLVNRAKIRHYQKWINLVRQKDLPDVSKCLLIGASGCGKTMLFRSLAEIVPFPHLVLDASGFSPTDATGGLTPAKVKAKIFATADRYLAQYPMQYFSQEGVLDQMVIFVDEFDKLSSNYDGSSGNWNEHVQTHFLTLFDNNQEFSEISWVFAGAFSGMEVESKKSQTGFLHNNSAKEDRDLDQAIIKYGLIPEIVGRINNICLMDVLNENNYYDILKNIILPKRMNDLQYFGVDKFKLTDEECRVLAKEAARSSLGVRYLHKEINKRCLDVEFYYEENN